MATIKGSIRQMEQEKPREKCRKWQLRIPTGLNPRTGKYSEKTRVVYGSYRDAQEALVEFSHEISKHPGRMNRKLLFEELCNEWIDHRLSMRLVAEVTADKDRICLNSLIRHFGKLRADKVTPFVIYDAMKKLMAGDSPSGKCLSGTTISMIVQAGRTMYRTYAVPYGISKINPFEMVDTPGIDTQERIPLNAVQVEHLMDMCPPNDCHHAAVALGVLAGLRRGEIVRLDWRQVNLEKGVVLAPDTKGSKRTTAIPMRPMLIEYLTKWKEAQKLQQENRGIRQTDATPVCANELGDRMHGGVLGRWWQRNRVRFGCEGVHFHDLRHTFATMLAEHNIHPRVIQELLRHKDDRMAMRVYTHVNVEQLRASVMSLDGD